MPWCLFCLPIYFWEWLISRWYKRDLKNCTCSRLVIDGSATRISNRIIIRTVSINAERFCSKLQLCWFGIDELKTIVWMSIDFLNLSLDYSWYSAGTGKHINTHRGIAEAERLSFTLVWLRDADRKNFWSLTAAQCLLNFPMPNFSLSIFFEWEFLIFFLHDFFYWAQRFFPTIFCSWIMRSNRCSC